MKFMNVHLNAMITYLKRDCKKRLPQNLQK